MKGLKPKDDQTSLGNILLEWGLITKEQLTKALQEQETLRGDDLLGRLLVAGGACTAEDIDMAMSAQASMRATGKTKRALAVADLALERHRRDSIIQRRDRIIQQAEQVHRSISNDYPTISAAMLAKSKES